jgi:hypothetical protein
MYTGLIAYMAIFGQVAKLGLAQDIIIDGEYLGVLYLITSLVSIRQAKSVELVDWLLLSNLSLTFLKTRVCDKLLGHGLKF